MEEGKSGRYMVSVLDRLTDMFQAAIKKAFPGLLNPPVAVTPSTKENFGDYQCNSAMGLAGVSGLLG